MSECFEVPAACFQTHLFDNKQSLSKRIVSKIEDYAIEKYFLTGVMAECGEYLSLIFIFTSLVG